MVAYMVTGTSGLPDGEHGLATGLTTLTQLVGLTLGIPVLSTIVTARVNALQATHSAADSVPAGVRVALLANGGVLVVGAVALALFFARGTSRRAAAAA
ncbi:hypothetical protein [Kitasatospora sp. NBC_01302]|uniref:hypothetical protein n=1 Tax=Kitasatospora sp. NBC_01302 TaxID=2903575 RepID=UPI002E12B839|nr:hypothetical protein OG294_21165 [Kitasatospora sp. NBC_01302]